MLMHLESQVSARNCAREEMLLCAFLEAAEGFFVAAVIKVISDLCQELVDTTTAPRGYSTDQRRSSGLKLALLCSRSQRAFPENNDD